MSADATADVRRFNRTVTERLGVLRDRFLGTGRPLGEARLLWEIGDGCELRMLRARLNLDSGYLSRSIRALEDAGLVNVTQSPGDARIRIATLTGKGRRERGLLDKRSDELAQSMLDPLNGRQRGELIGAMTTVERLLTASLVDVRVLDPEHRDAQHCLNAYFDELERRSNTKLEPATLAAAKPHEMRRPEGVLLVAYLRGEPVGCGALKLNHRAPAEIKRMWVAAEARGLGLGRRLLGELESAARERRARAARLETNHTLVEAIALYRSSGYVEVEPFNDEPFADHWFEKRFLRAR
jgi:DNA-binding MarR family transcriptional regulator/ribosomal protein S18 acetylase RimI-like enzyme